jgi:hypothetical protein
MTGSASCTANKTEPTAAAGRLRAIYAAMAISSVGSVLNIIGLLAYLYYRTGSALPVGLAVLLNFLPVILIVPFAGSRLTPDSLRTVASGAAFGEAALAGLMAIVVAHDGPLAPLFVASAALGVLTQLLWISVLSQLPRIVAAGRIRSGNIAIQLASQTGAIVGAIALISRGTATTWWLFVADAASFVVQGLLLRFMLPAPSRGPGAAVPARADADDEADEATEPGRRLTRAESGFAVAMPAGFIALNLLNVAIPLMVLDSLASGQRQYAMAETAYPLAAIIVGVLLRRNFRVPAPAAIAAIGAGFVILGFADSVPVLLIAVAVFGGSVMVANAAIQSLVQTSVPARRLPGLQSVASAIGAALSALVIVGVTIAFSRHDGRLALVLVGVIYLAAFAPFTAILLRRHAPDPAGAAL